MKVADNHTKPKILYVVISLKLCMFKHVPCIIRYVGLVLFSVISF